MGDSDEEYDRRRRDKFRGERNDYDNRRPPKGYDRGRGRHDNSWDRGTKRDYQGNKDTSYRRDNIGRNSSPPNKKRRDWEGNEQPSWKGGGYQESNVLIPSADKGSGVASFMSFKEFVMQQDDDIDEIESVRRYQEYKVEYKRTQINDFFVLHKNEEWFKDKYHPIDSVDRKRFVRNAIRKRLRVFLDLWEEGYMDDFSLDFSYNEVVLKLLDRVVVKLEGGSDEDVKAIDLPPPPEPVKPKEETNTLNGIKKTDIKQEDEEEKEPLPPGVEEDDEPLPPGVEEEEKPEEEEKMEEDKKEEEEIKKEEPVQKKYVYDGSHLKRPLSIFMRTLQASVTKADLESICQRYPGFLRVAMSEPFPERRYARHSWATFEPSVNIKDICWNLSNIRVKDVDLTPVVNRDVTNRVRAVTGLTCSPMCMQQDVVYALKLMKTLDEKRKLYYKEEPYPKVAKTDETTNQPPKEAVKTETDIKKEDGETNEEDKSEKKVSDEEEELNIPDENPVLLKMPEDVEEIVTGIEIEDEEDGKKEYKVVINEELMKALDLVLLYLRIVHCVDFYNGNEYAHEEEMPVRCGIMHIRGTQVESTCKKDVQEWHKPNTQKLEHLLKEDEFATDSEAEKLGKKNEDTEVENFIKANTQELAKDKWLCPLSGKKFRGPEFIRKHIMMKHGGAVDDVKLEVQYFNNYVYDMRRPCFPDPRPRTGVNTGASNMTTPQPGIQSGARQWGSGSRPQVVFAQKPPYMQGGYQPSTPQIQSAIAADTYGRVNTYPPKQRRGGFHDRRIIKYRDLDAPEESDFF